MSGSNQEQQEQAPQQAQDQLQHLILQLLPQDHSFIGNITLLQQLTAAAGAPPSEEAFKAAREALVAAGHAVKGKGRGGSTARAADATRAATMARPDFELQAVAVTPDMLAATPAPKPRQPKASAPAASGEPQVISYRHPDRRKNNPEVGLVNEASDPEQPKTTYAYDPHLDPALQFDSARARAEQLIDDALAGNDPVAMRHALEELRRRSNPYLQWTGKAERTSFDIDTVSLHVHERIDAMSILSAVSKRQGKKGDKAGKAATGGIQPGLFEAPFESLPLRSAVDFYKHDRGWANRLVAGDSLLVMNSLLQKESMAGQVQMIYIDPPYGIKYGSNFQPFTNKRDVKDRSDADLTQEPEMIKAFRDTWELGIHSYLTYLRDRLLLAKELLSESGSVFVQISDENLHRVRIVLDEIFGSENFVSLITYSTTGGFATSTLSRTGDYIIWYAKNISKVKFSRLYIKKSQADAVLDDYDQLEQLSGLRRPLTQAEKRSPEKLHELGRCFTDDNPTSQGEGAATGDFKLAGLTFHPGDGNHWKAPLPHGMRRISRSKRLIITPKNKLRYLRYFSDFDQKPVTNAWFDIAGAVQDRADPKVYVVQTSNKIIERCLLLTTDPGDLVLDPTCGSGTTAYVAEKWGAPLDYLRHLPRCHHAGQAAPDDRQLRLL